MCTKTLEMPQSKSDDTLSEVTSAGPIVVVGANGSGKTRPEEVHTRSLEKVAERW